MIARLPDPVRSRAVLIGTSTYADPKFPALPGVANNLVDLGHVLTSRLGADLPAENCVAVLDPPDQTGVGELVAQAAEQAEDLLLVYYAGHGEMTWDRTNELCLTMRDTRSTSLRTSALRCADLRQYIGRSTARIRVLVLDCCYGGTALSETMSTTDTVLSEVDVAGAYVLAATYGRALAPAEQRNTLFTGELLRLLREGVATEPGMFLTLDALFRESRSVLRRQGHPEPCSNHSDTATLLALAPNAAHKVRTVLADLRGRVTRLAEAEAETRLACSEAVEKIAWSDPPMPVPVASELADRVDVLDRQARRGLPPEAGDLDEVEASLADALAADEEMRDLVTGQVDLRDELRGRLDAYQAMAVRLGIAEENGVSARYADARDLLWVRPCELTGASQAVETYLHEVVERREGQR